MAAELVLSDVWGQVLAAMQVQFAKPTFEMWLKQTRPVGFSDDALIVAVNNPFALDMIRNTYLPQIQTLLQQVVGRPVNVHLVVPPTAAETAATAEGAAAAETAATSEGSAMAEGAATTVVAAAAAGSATAQGSEVLQPRPEALSAEAIHEAFQSVRLPYRRGLVPSLNPKYTFESFVVGNSNRFAHAGALAVADAPGRAYNPLFIYGGAGLGKTHLMQAIGHQAARKFPELSVLYVTSETFTNELINAIRDDRTHEFKTRYRSIDVLLIDDIQFIAGKERTQVEFFHTFESLHGASRQIVISSDRPPREIPTLEERLRSRFEWGLLADIQAPDLETRIAILRKKALNERLPVPDDVMAYVASQIPTNIRELEGALIRIVASASLDNMPVTLELAAKALKDILPNRTVRQVTFSDIERAVSRHFSVTVDDLKGQSRARKMALPRQIAMYLCRDLTSASLPRIGEEFGDRDHTTVLHACDKIGRLQSEDRETRETLAALVAALQATPIPG